MGQQQCRLPTILHNIILVLIYVSILMCAPFNRLPDRSTEMVDNLVGFKRFEHCVERSMPRLIYNNESNGSQNSRNRKQVNRV